MAPHGLAWLDWPCAHEEETWQLARRLARWCDPRQSGARPASPARASGPSRCPPRSRKRSPRRRGGAARASSGLTAATVRREDLPLPGLAATLAGWAAELSRGRAFVLIRGFPVGALSEPATELAYVGLGLHLGTPVSQNAAGDLLGHVRDTGWPGTARRCACTPPTCSRISTWRCCESRSPGTATTSSPPARTRSSACRWSSTSADRRGSSSSAGTSATRSGTPQARPAGSAVRPSAPGRRGRAAVDPGTAAFAARSSSAPGTSAWRWPRAAHAPPRVSRGADITVTREPTVRPQITAAWGRKSSVQRSGHEARRSRWRAGRGLADVQPL